MATSSDHYDVAVVGLGGVGSAAAWHLSRRGLRVLGLDRFHPPHDRGSSHGRSRLIRQVYAEDPAYVPLAQRAYELWRELEQQTGDELLTITGGLTLGSEGSDLVEGAVRAATEWGLAHELLDTPGIRDRFPTIAPPTGTVAVYDPIAGVVRPEASVAAHLGLAERDGAALHLDEPVLGIEPTNSGVRVRTASADYSCTTLVVSAGAWAAELLTDLAVPLEVERQVQVWFRPERPDAFRAGRQPVLVWEYDEKSGAGFYSAPAIEDGEVKVAFHHRGVPCSPDSVDRRVHPDDVADLEAVIAPLLPDLSGRFLRAAACLYTNTPDRHFVIGRHPAHEHVVVAAGFSGHGFKFVPVLGEIVADLVTTGTTRWPIDLFAPDRRTHTGGPHGAFGTVTPSHETDQ